MKKLLAVGIILFAALSLKAQKVYFIYIQSDSKSPFYVKMGEKVSSSTASGYLILSKLKDSSYAFQIGPSANEKELRFEVALKGKDRGFLLKKFSESWSLFDLQTLERLNPVGNGSAGALGSKLGEDRFTSLLARAADDTSLLYQQVAFTQTVAAKKKTESKDRKITPQNSISESRSLVQDTQAIAITASPEKKESLAASAAPEPATAVIVEKEAIPATVVSTTASDANLSNEYKRSVITRKSETTTDEGLGLVFFDAASDHTDTIRLVIPNQKVVFTEAETASEQPVTEVVKPSRPTFSCGSEANEKDYFKLRKSLASIDAESDMTKEALTYFRKKCFSTEQIKGLSSLFLTQAGKYAFLEASFPFVADRGNFQTLQSELFDPGYIARFKTLISY